MMMPHFPSETDRERLGFVDAVCRSFGFLTTEFGFTIVTQTPTMVRFEGNRTIVQVFHGRSSYVLGVEIGLKTPSRDGEVRYSLRELVALDESPGDVDYGEFQISSAVRLPAFVEQLAELTRRIGVKALEGDLEIFERLAEQRRREGRVLTDASTAMWLREQAGKAWQDRDFASVVDAYAALASLETVEMRRSETARLAYARRQLAGLMHVLATMNRHGTNGTGCASKTISGTATYLAWDLSESLP
jgi:hypothetical protein